MIPRAFVTTGLEVGQSVLLDGEDGHHFVRVLRVKPGEPMALAANGQAVLGTIERVDQAGGTVTVRLERTLPSHEALVRVFVVQCMAKGDKIEEVLQKCTELGAAGFLIVESERSVARLEPSRMRQKLDRWRKQVKEAASQSHRDLIPVVEVATSWQDVGERLQAHQVGIRLLFDEDESKRGLRAALEAVQPDDSMCASVGVLIGPEGGWSDGERERLQESLGAQCVTLGPRILRTETAGPAAVAAILYEFGEMGGR